MKQIFKFYWMALLFIASIVIIGCPSSGVLRDLEKAENIMDKSIAASAVDDDGNERTQAQLDTAEEANLLTNATDAMNLLKNHMDGLDSDNKLTTTSDVKQEVVDQGVVIHGRYLRAIGKAGLGEKGISFVSIFSSFLNTEEEKGTGSDFEFFATLLPERDFTSADLTDLSNIKSVLDKYPTVWATLATELATAQAALAEALWYLKEDYEEYDSYNTELYVIRGFLSFYVFNAIANGQNGYANTGSIPEGTASLFVNNMDATADMLADAGLSAAVITTIEADAASLGDAATDADVEAYLAGKGL